MMTIVFALQKYESFDLRKSNSLAKKSKRGVTLTGRLTWLRIFSSDFLEFEAPFKPEATVQSFLSRKFVHVEQNHDVDHEQCGKLRFRFRPNPN